MIEYRAVKREVESSDLFGIADKMLIVKKKKKKFAGSRRSLRQTQKYRQTFLSPRQVKEEHNLMVRRSRRVGTVCKTVA